MLLPLNFDCFNNLLDRDNFLDIYDEFKLCQSRRGINSHQKNQYPSNYTSIPLLFRDEQSSAEDSLNTDLQSEHLTHLRMKQKDWFWLDEDGYPLSRWDSMSRDSLIYSYFVYKAVRYYFIVDHVENNPRVILEYKHTKSVWFTRAKEYRTSIII